MREITMPELKVELPEPRRIKAKDVFLSYILDHHVEEIIHLLKEPLISSHVAVQISFMPLMQHHVEVAEALLSKPDRLLPVLCNAVVQAQKNFLQMLQLQHEKETLSEEEQAFLDTHRLSPEAVKVLSVKENVHPRLAGVPCPAETRVPRSAEVGLLLCFSGTVVRASAPRLLRHTLLYTCDTCAHLVPVKADHDQYYSASKPLCCNNPHISCYSKNFSSAALPDAAHTADYQEVKLQELVSGGGAGGSSIPQSVWVTLHHDLVDSCKPGDDVLVCGSVVRRWKPAARDARPAIEIVIRANNITVRNKQEGNASIKPELEREFEQFWKQYRHKPLIGRDIILASVCPQMYGLYLVKLAVAVVLCGGVQRVDTGGSRVRGEPHLLLVGDPGTGKSQLLQWACSAGSRAVLTTGVGSTTAGLTVAAVREPGGDWGLEAGALVLADGGVCCIDEFSSVREADRAALHEAMEQQTISVAKAGMVCKLNSRCSVLAATNPKGRYDPTQPLNLNVGVASPLLSRFDLILVLLDTNSPNWDQLVSSYILSGGAAGGLPGGDPVGASKDCLWRLDKMRAYFRYARRLQPRLSAAADAVLCRFYQMQRSNGCRDQSRTTIRLLESLVRLSQGHARLMLHSEVRLQDAVVAVGLWEAAMGPPAALERHQHAGNATLHAGFPIDPTASYRQLAENLLRRLQLEEELREELERLDEEDRQSSAQDLAAILGGSPRPEAGVTEERGSDLVFKVPEATAAHAASVPAEPLVRRPPTYLYATQESRRRDLIEELEDAAPHIPKRVQQKNTRSRNKKSVKRKEKTSRIDKYLKNTRNVPIKKRKIGAPGRKKKEIFVISSESESTSSTSESEADSTPATTGIFQSISSLPTTSAGKPGDVGNEKANSSEGAARPSKAKFSFCSEELVNVVGRQSPGESSNNKSSVAVSPKPSSGLSSNDSLRDNTGGLTIANNRKENESLSIASPLTAPNSLSKKIVAKRKQSDESPFCVNASLKRARVTKQVVRPSKCKSKVQCDAPEETREILRSSSDPEKPNQLHEDSKAESSNSLDDFQITKAARNEISSASKKNILELGSRGIVSSTNSIEDEINIADQNSEATNSSVDTDRAAGGAGCGDSVAANSVDDSTSTATNGAGCGADGVLHEYSTECGDGRAANSAGCDIDEVAKSGGHEKPFSLSQKARSFLEKYAFSNGKNLRKSDNSSLASRTIGSETMVGEASKDSATGSTPSVEQVQAQRFEMACSVNDCNVDTAIAVAQSGANLGDPGALVDSIEAANESLAPPDTGLNSSFCSTKLSSKKEPLFVSKLTRFAFVPKAPQDGDSTITKHKLTSGKNLKNSVQENCPHEGNFRTGSDPRLSSNYNNNVQNLKTPAEDSCLDAVARHDERLEASEKTGLNLGLEKNFASDEGKNLKSADTRTGGCPPTKRLCFDLGADGGFAQVDRIRESSVRKSFKKFASSQDLDENFDF